MLRDASDWVTWISEAPFARAVVFGVNIGGIFPIHKTAIVVKLDDLCERTHILLPLDPAGHLFVEGLLLVVILFLLSQKSYKPPKRPLTKKVCRIFPCHT